jgi:hypothetical protein
MHSQAVILIKSFNLQSQNATMILTSLAFVAFPVTNFIEMSIYLYTFLHGPFQ